MLATQATRRHEERIQHLEAVVQFLLLKADPIQVPVAPAASPNVDKFRYSTGRGLEPIVSEETARSLIAGWQCGQLRCPGEKSPSPAACPTTFASNNTSLPLKTLASSSPQAELWQPQPTLPPRPRATTLTLIHLHSEAQPAPSTPASSASWPSPPPPRERPAPPDQPVLFASPQAVEGRCSVDKPLGTNLPRLGLAQLDYHNALAILPIDLCLYTQLSHLAAAELRPLLKPFGPHVQPSLTSTATPHSPQPNSSSSQKLQAHSCLHIQTTPGHSRDIPSASCPTRPEAPRRRQPQRALISSRTPSPPLHPLANPAPIEKGQPSLPAPCEPLNEVPQRFSQLPDLPPGMHKPNHPARPA
ncbi:hypothetical protein PtA15_11A200 [Puccinia triticina]|uniref:Uncharacterized protein n=1 Tax=Puccinia triticina TaxID=208348 RepID=A0ABY7CW55_9BASI|nr:uncharacterized protein PtA15_11A200 [Puccinia triticina]WAQ89511.1 hypothetical protein PtA15_11A200 [Puccinia triticina]